MLAAGEYEYVMSKWAGGSAALARGQVFKLYQAELERGASRPRRSGIGAGECERRPRWSAAAVHQSRWPGMAPLSDASPLKPFANVNSYASRRCSDSALHATRRGGQKNSK